MPSTLNKQKMNIIKTFKLIVFAILRKLNFVHHIMEALLAKKLLFIFDFVLFDPMSKDAFNCGHWNNHKIESNKIKL